MNKYAILFPWQTPNLFKVRMSDYSIKAKAFKVIVKQTYKCFSLVYIPNSGVAIWIWNKRLHDSEQQALDSIHEIIG